MDDAMNVERIVNGTIDLLAKVFTVGRDSM